MKHRTAWWALAGLAAIAATGCSPQHPDTAEAPSPAPVLQPQAQPSRSRSRRRIAVPPAPQPADETQKVAEAPADPPPASPTDPTPADQTPAASPAPEVESPPAISSTELPKKPVPRDAPAFQGRVSTSDAVSEIGSPETGKRAFPIESSSPKIVSDAPPEPPSEGEPAALNPPRLRSAPPALEPRPSPIPPPRRRSNTARSARLALIIDDVGMSTSQIAPFLDLDADLTYSIIPETRQARRCLSLIESRGRVPLLHLPMEPLNRKDLLSPGGISVDLGSDEIERRVGRYLDELHGVRGVNNHMGSLATQDERVMESVLDVVKQHGLFFIDSKTVQRTVVAQVADRVGVAHASRDGEFLDDGGNTSRAYQIVLDLGREAQRSGSAIGIGHPHPGTARAIARALPELEAMGVRIVPVSELVHGGG